MSMTDHLFCVLLKSRRHQRVSLNLRLILSGLTLGCFTILVSNNIVLAENSHQGHGDSKDTQEHTRELQQNPKLTGRIVIDGSSTVYPITEAVAEEYQEKQPKVKITIGVSGSGGGFKKFLAGDTDINNASRPISEQEIRQAKKSGFEYIELPIAYDGISVVVHPKNTWVDELSASQLKALWQPSSAIKLWSDLDSRWPKRAIKLYGPGADSGTFDYFTRKVNGKARASRSDYTASEDDSVLVKGVAGDRDAL
ncbi:MAG: PstS family phosphate ABC transporter substrate-binding protein, partial [Proteobacteria bacterium]|nr:PstS family phosphate ABC transporter substrate-binding protein [Pseudomonadota bacterium]